MSVLPHHRRATVVETPTTFSWDAVGGAGSYQLEIGYSSGGSDYLVVDVGNVLTYTRSLPRGTYYTRVRAVVGGTPGIPAPERLVMVP